MNAKAQELGLSNTHFESPHGLDSDAHYTTAYELAVLSDYALKNPTFLSIVATKNHTVTINGYPKALSNTNELLGVLDGVYGVKTGFTNGANRCLVTACKRGNMDIICVVLGADTKNFRTKDSIKLIEYTFKTYEYFDMNNYVKHSISEWQKKNPHFFWVEKGIADDLQIKLDSSLEEHPTIPLKKDWISNVTATITMKSNLQAPVGEGDFLGKLTVSSGENTIAEFNLVSDTNVRKNNMFDYLLNFLKIYPYPLEDAIF